MSVGLLALLDDVAAIAQAAAATIDDVASQAARTAAASLDDVAGHAAKAATKSAGVVIDDAAVTPRYVTGFSPARELPIVGQIALGSLKNKLLILLPAALILSLVAPQAVVPLLMLGGAFLCYEGAEKVYEKLFPHAAHAHEEKVVGAESAEALERRTVAGAIRTDFILSAEIMAITLSAVPDAGFVTQALVLALVGVGITALVYGAVALIVKADDVGLALAGNPDDGLWGRALRAFGRGIVRAMPHLLTLLKIVGTAAMIWVGGGILIHGFAVFGLAGVEHALAHAGEGLAHLVPQAPALAAWSVHALGSGVLGLAVGLALIPLVGAAAPLVGRLMGMFRRG